MIRFENGAMLTIESSFAAHIERDLWNVQVMGEKGGANFETGQLFTDVGGFMMTSTPAHLSETQPFEYKMRHFVEVARGVRYNEVPPEHGLMVQQMLDAIYESAAKGREVTVF